MAKLDIVSSNLVPISTNEIPMSRLDLTPWDLQLLLLDPIQKGMLFHNPKSLQKNINIINHLKTTFSRTLNFFPPLAGRLGTIVNNDNNNFTIYFVDCNNRGAEFTHAIADTISVTDISEARYIPEFVSSFFPLNGVPNFEGVSKPLLGVQVTELADGLFIGCTANHVVIDGTSFWHFINSWSELSRGFDKISENPIFKRDFYDLENCGIPIPAFDKDLLQNSSPLRLLERVFHFSQESVAKLKAKANSEAGSDNKISSFQALLAHLWRSVARCRYMLKNNILLKTHEIQLTLSVGARARIPLQEGYFGNAITISSFSVSESEVLQNGIGHTGLKINVFISQQASKAAMSGFLKDWVKNPSLMRRGLSNFLVSSSPRYNVYGNDFGWGKPIAVRSGKAQKRDGKMTFFPAIEPGGIDVEVCLATETLKALEDDAEFMEAVAF